MSEKEEKQKVGVLAKILRKAAKYDKPKKNIVPVLVITPDKSVFLEKGKLEGATIVTKHQRWNIPASYKPFTFRYGKRKVAVYLANQISENLVDIKEGFLEMQKIDAQYYKIITSDTVLGKLVKAKAKVTLDNLIYLALGFMSGIVFYLLVYSRYFT